MCDGGGGGDGGAAQREQARQAQQDKAVAAVNRIFGVASNPTVGTIPDKNQFMVSQSNGDGAPTQSFDQSGYDKALGDYNEQLAAQKADQAAPGNKAARDVMYGKVRGDVFDYNKNKLDFDKGTAARQMKFFLAGQGLSGGSSDIDQNAEIQRRYDTGLLDIGNRADAAGNDMRSNDERARLDLISRVRAGMDQGSAVSGALTTLDNNAKLSRDSALASTINNVFGDLGNVYANSKLTQGMRNAQMQNPLGAWNTAPSYGGTTTSAG